MSVQANILEYSAKKQCRMARRWVTLLLILSTVVYASAYWVSLSYRKPAMDLRYFYYSENEDADICLYYLFYPPYQVHKRLGWRFVLYNGDRRAVRFDDDAAARSNPNYAR